jgi:SAM-dependent methyltransferase
VGTELEVFRGAENWRAYWQGFVRPYLGRRVLEVGAGIGTVTAGLCDGARDQWLALEPDPALAAMIVGSLERGEIIGLCHVLVGKVADLATEDLFDSILYIDVLEHIMDHEDELHRAVAHLRPGGHLIVLVPAHQRLFTPFDAAIGHHRRYSRGQLLRLAPADLRPIRALYLDSMGMLASLVNRLLLKAAQPTQQQIALWDRVLVRLSRIVDPLSGYYCGKSVLAIWQRS